MSNHNLKSFEDKLNELPEDRRNLIIEYGEDLYEKYRQEQFQIANEPQTSIHDLFKFSDFGSIHVILNDSHEEYLRIVDQINEKDFIEWVNPIDECYLDGRETPKQQIERVEGYYSLACEGCNVIIRTNSYFVIKKLYLLAMKNWECYNNENGTNIYMLNKTKDEIWQLQDFGDGMPDNFIVDASIDLYTEGLSL